MHFSIQREALLKPLQLIAGVVERRQTLPVLSNLLLTVNDQILSIAGTDLEVELVGRIRLEEPANAGQVTVSAHKLMDICKSLPSDALLDINLQGQNIILKAGRSRFSLATLPAKDFPIAEDSSTTFAFNVSQATLKQLIERCAFAMAKQDVRYYLNGMLLELESNQLRAVATDGHRLALSTVATDLLDTSRLQVIIPRKGVLELSKLLAEEQGEVQIQLGQHQARATLGDFTFSTKLVDGKFPDYQRVLPQPGQRLLVADCRQLQDSFARISILCNEKFRGIRLQTNDQTLKVQANNPEHESAEEEIEVEFRGEPLDIGFNVGYLLDVLQVIHSEKVRIALADGNNSALIQNEDDDSSSYVVMPMRL